MDFDYSVRVSSRAKRMSLKITPAKGLEVVVPRKFDHSKIEPFVTQKQHWVKRHLEKYSQTKELNDFPWPPKSLDLIALDQQVHIHFKAPLKANVIQLVPCEEGVIIYADRQHKVQIIQVLIKHLISIAQTKLIPKLSALAMEHNISINRVSIRAQKTRWGSCSSKGNINLNYKLLFLSEEHMHYIMMHELAHRFHLNHSAQYWAVLTELLPNARLLDQQIRRSTHRIPHWLDI